MISLDCFLQPMNPANNVTSYAYDLMSNLTGLTDALNRTTNYTYDEFNRLTKIK